MPARKLVDSTNTHEMNFTARIPRHCYESHIPLRPESDMNFI